MSVLFNRQSVRFLTGLHVTLAEGKKESVITIIRTGNFNHPKYGRFAVDLDLLNGMVSNFKAGAYGQRIFIDVAHEPEKGAAGEIKELFVDGKRLRARVEWTPYGIDAIQNRKFIYVSADYIENWIDNEFEKEHGAVLFGAGLVTRPHIKNMDAVQLSESDDGNVITLLHPELVKNLKQEHENMWKELIKQLAEALGGFGLTDVIVKQLKEGFEASLQGIDDEAKAKVLLEAWTNTGEKVAKQLRETQTATTIQLQAPSVSGLSEADVKKLLEQHQQDTATAARQLKEQLDKNVKLFNDTIDAAKGLKTLSEENIKMLKEAGDMVTADMTDSQVKRLAAHQITLGQQFAVNSQLAGMGYQVNGHVQVADDTRNKSMTLQESILKELRGTMLHTQGGLRLAEKANPFTNIVLSEFDRIHAPRIHEEAKRLSGGATGMADSNLPVGFQRTVIYEALSDLRVLELVQTLTDFSATVTTQIPYEERDTSAIYNGGVVYEGQPIHRASVSQKMDTAYLVPTKLAFLISNEIMHFSRASQINWDAYGRNVQSNARVVRELIVQRICNELQRAADSYSATTRSNEGFDAQLDGATSTVKTTYFPIVRPSQMRDMQGNAVGTEKNPITVRLDGTAISAWDGTGNQTAGTYYRVVSYNLGYIQFVDEAGLPVTPANAAGADDITYSEATNVKKFDLDNGAVDLDLHLNGLLRAIGAQKAMLSGDRFVKPDFQLMSETMNDTCTNARNFESSAKKNGTDTTAMGDLETVKGIPAWATNAPNIDLGDERIILGQRGLAGYTIAKPFTTGEPFEVVDPTTGQPTGQKQAYGEEYSAVKVPEPVANRITSVLAYSASTR